MGGDAELAERLRGGDQEAFETLACRYHTTMIGLAAAYVPSRAAAEEVVQDSWMGMLRGLDRFGGQVSLKTWLFGIVVDRARIASGRKRRSIPAAAAALGPARFAADGSWVRPPLPWPADVDERLRAPAAQQGIRAAIEALPRGPAAPCCCATSRACPAARSARCSGSARPASGCCCTAGGRRSARLWSSRSGGCEVMPRFGRTAIVCRKAADLFTDYLEDALPAPGRARFEAHLAGCPHCTEYLRQMRATIGAVGRMQPDSLSPQARDELIALYQRWRAERHLAEGPGQRQAPGKTA